MVAKAAEPTPICKIAIKNKSNTTLTILDTIKKYKECFESPTACKIPTKKLYIMDPIDPKK